MRELQQLLHEAAQSPPADGLDMDRVLSSGRRRVRRRRVGTVAGTGVAVAAIAVGSVLASGLGLDVGDRIAPAGGTEPVGPVVRLADASEAVEGRDYTLLTTVTNENLDTANGQYYEAVTRDGLIVLKDARKEMASPPEPARLGLLDPRTGQVSWLPAPPEGALGGLLDVSERWLVWVPSLVVEGELGLAVYDRETGEWRELGFTFEQLGLDPAAMPFLESAVVGPDERLYLGVSNDLHTDSLWSVSPEDPSDLRDEGLDVGAWDIEGDELTFTETHDEPSSIIHVRDLRTGDERTFDAQSGSTCNALGLQRTGDTIALTQYCGTDGKVRDDRVQVVTAAGDPVVTVQDDSIDGGALTSRYLTVAAFGGAQGGTYAYDLDSGDLLRLSEGDVKFDPTLEGHGNLLTWATPVNNRHGMKLWAAELH